jgi:hypothetical protein
LVDALGKIGFGNPYTASGALDVRELPALAHQPRRLVVAAEDVGDLVEIEQPG